MHESLCQLLTSEKPLLAQLSSRLQNVYWRNTICMQFLKHSWVLGFGNVWRCVQVRQTSGLSQMPLILSVLENLWFWNSLLFSTFFLFVCFLIFYIHASIPSILGFCFVFPPFLLPFFEVTRLKAIVRLFFLHSLDSWSTALKCKGCDGIIKVRVKSHHYKIIQRFTLAFLISVPSHKVSLVISFIISFVFSFLPVPLQNIPLLTVCKIISNSIVCLFKKGIIWVTWASFQ